MTTRLLGLFGSLYALSLMVGCSASVEVASEQVATPNEQKVQGWVRPVAPSPRLRGEPRFIATSKLELALPIRPWSELILGRWLRIEPETFGQIVWEFTKDGKFKRCYSYPAAPDGNFRAGVERNTEDYRINGNVLFPTSTFDDEARATESTTFIDSLTASELHIYAVRRVRRSLQTARAEAQGGKMTLEQALAEVLNEERTAGSLYIKLKN